MKLYYSKTSPFVRKVLITAWICGKFNDIKIIDLNPNGTYSPDENYKTKNPLTKIPALEIHNNDTLFDSPVICEYLAKISQNHHIYPQDFETYFFQKKIEALSDGLCDAAVLRVMESRRPHHERSASFDLSQATKVQNALDYLETVTYRLSNIPDRMQIGDITTACALGYLDFRFPNEPWHDNHPQLANWFSTIKNWSAFEKTNPN